MLALEDSTIVITGASSGIGRELARQVADRARALVLIARRVDRLQELKDELSGANPRLRVHLLPCDLGDRGATEATLGRLASEVGDVDVPINNAGLGDLGVFDHTRWPKIQSLIDVNITALTYLTHRLLPGMLARRRGGILNVSSGFGLEWFPGFAVYAATKHYVTAFTEAVRVEARAAGVVVSQVCPGPVATEFEEISGNLGMKVPSFLEISATRCARAALRGFAAGRAMIIPGVIMNLMRVLGAISPRMVKRLVYGPLARQLRARQEKDVTKPG